MMNTYKKYCKICEAITQHFEDKTGEIKCLRCYELHTTQARHNYEEEMKYKKEDENV